MRRGARQRGGDGPHRGRPGTYKTLLDADRFLPESWDADRPRRRAADIPDGVVYRAKWQIAPDQVRRATANGVRFDGFTFDEGYGDKPGFLTGLEADGVVYVGGVPRDFPTADGPAARVAATDGRLTRAAWRVVRVPHQTGADAGLKHLAPFTGLTGLHLNGTKVTDAGMQYIATRTKLTELGLGGTGVTDEGLKSLAPLTDLGFLHLVGTAVTDGGAARLRAALAKCAISR